MHTDELGALTGLYFPEHWYLPPSEAFGRRVAVDDDPLLAEAREQLTGYLAGERSGFDLPVRTRGSALEERVWGGRRRQGDMRTRRYTPATTNSRTAGRHSTMCRSRAASR